MGIKATSVIQYSELEDSTSSTRIRPGRHAVEKKKFKSGHPPGSWIFKAKKRGNGDIERIEAVLGDLYQALLGDDRSPDTLVVKEGVEVIGVMSKELPSYYSLYDLFYDQKKDAVTGRRHRIHCEKLVSKGLGRLMAACYILEENDLHGGNWGFELDAGGKIVKIVKIDHDQSLFSITADYLGWEHQNLDYMRRYYPDTYEEHIFKNYRHRGLQLKTMVKDLCSKITKHDLMNLGNQESNFPMNSIANNARAGLFSGLSEIDKNPEFKNDKWSVLLKCQTLRGDKLQEILAKHVDAGPLYDKLNGAINARMEVLDKTLVTIPEFRDYVLNNARPEAISNEFLERIAAAALKEATHELQSVEADLGELEGFIRRFEASYSEAKIELNVAIENHNSTRNVHSKRRYENARNLVSDNVYELTKYRAFLPEFDKTISELEQQITDIKTKVETLKTTTVTADSAAAATEQASAADSAAATVGDTLPTLDESPQKLIASHGLFGARPGIDGEHTVDSTDQNTPDTPGSKGPKSR